MEIASAFTKSKSSKSPSRLRRAGEPKLAEFRQALVGRRYETLAVTAFAMLMGVSFVYLIGRAQIISPNNAYTLNAAAAMVAFKGEAYSGARALAASAEQAATAAPARVATMLGAAGAPLAPGAGVAPAATKVAATIRQPAPYRRLARARRRGAVQATSRGTSVAGAAPSTAAASVATEGLYQGSTSQRISNWVLYEFPERLNDESAKAYYGLLSFFGGVIDLRSIPDIRGEAEGWLDWLDDLLGINTFSGGLSLSDPGQIFQGSSLVDTAVAGAGAVLLVMLFFGLVLSARETLRDSARRARRRRVGEGI